MASSFFRSCFVAITGALAAFAFSTAARADEPVPAAPVVIVVPEPAPPVQPVEPTPAPIAPRFGRWVFEAGIFAAYMNGSMDDARVDGDPASIGVFKSTPEGTETTSCADVGCSYSLGRRSSLAGGVSLFAGYAATDWLHVGGRMLAGPRLRGGMIFASGPSVSMHMWGPLWVGASVFFGYASQSERSGTVTAPAPYSLASTDYHAMTAATEMAMGAGFELRAELFHTAGGAFAVDVQPLFLAGSPGSAFLLPVGISYRWR
ncbi:MAG: hypothetical protein QM820_54425 [Minicystis sp.]